MSVYRPNGQRIYVYDFCYKGERYRGSTLQKILKDARAVESELKTRVRRQAGGVLRAQDTPRFSEWAGVYYEYVVKVQKLAAPQHVMDTLRVVLRFWGGPTEASKAIEPHAPFHDLRLADPIEDADWIMKFDEWITARGVSNQQRNHYMSCMSRMYRCALDPRFRKHSGVQLNPFLGVGRQKTPPRTVTLSLDQIRAFIAHAPSHVRLAIAVAALAPKLRLRNVLALEWRRHFDRDFLRIELAQHKTARVTGLPMVAPISVQLRGILLEARQRDPEGTHVVMYRGQPVRRGMRDAVASAMERAGITYGRDVTGGATFHTLRHSMATLLAELDEADAKRAAFMGQTPATLAKYTHLRVVGQQQTAERLSAAMPIADVVHGPPRRRGKRITGTLPDQG